MSEVHFGGGKGDRFGGIRFGHGEMYLGAIILDFSTHTLGYPTSFRNSSDAGVSSCRRYEFGN